MSVPEKIGRYEIIQQLGQGGMAVVYLARDPYMDRQVAVKLLPRQLTPNEALRGRFQTEARIVASLEHPAIVPVHDFGEFNDQPYIVMRYMVGGSLGRQLEGQPVPLPEVVRILSPLAQALDKAHLQHIIHRDLKPDNILFDGDNNPYLSDFGIARLAEGTQTQSIMGTPAYMSPEQIKGDVELDGRSDIYALGVILFQMLSGEQPYTAETPTQVMMKHVLDPIPIILDKDSDLPPMTQMVIERAMAKERADRYATAEEIVQAVKELLTASQAAEVGAAIAATMIQETMLEIPEEEVDPYATVVEQYVPPPGSSEIEREAQAAALYAQLQAAAAAEDWIDALAIGAELQELDPNYRDVPAILADAQAQLTMPASAKRQTERAAEKVEPAAVEPDEVEKKTPSRGRQILFLGCAIIFLLFLCLITVGLLGNYISDGEDAQATADAAAVSSSVVDLQPAATEVDLISPTATEVEKETSTPEPTITPQEPTPQPSAEPVELLPAGVLFSDNFDGNSSADSWDLWQDESAEFGVGDGKLLAIGMDETTLNWVNQVDFYTDLEVSVAADIWVGGNSAFFGVVFDGDGDNYVGCFVQGDSSAYCSESLEGETDFSDWVVVDLSVLRDNEILFVVNNEEWAMSVNNKCVGSGFVNFGPVGQPGLAVSTADNADVASIAYDDFQIRTPTEEGLALLRCEPEYFE